MSAAAAETPEPLGGGSFGDTGLTIVLTTRDLERLRQNSMQDREGWLLGILNAAAERAGGRREDTR